MKNWGKQFNEKYNTDGCGKALVLIEDTDTGTTQRPAHEEIKDFIDEIIKTEKQEILNKIDTFICKWLTNHANIPIEKRKEPFHEVVDLRNDLLKDL